LKAIVSSPSREISDSCTLTSSTPLVESVGEVVVGESCSVTFARVDEMNWVTSVVEALTSQSGLYS